jgi:hypothetical protein
MTSNRPVKIQPQLARILDSDEQNGDATEGTHHGRKLTGMMAGTVARDRAPKPRRFEQLLDSLQDRELFSTFCHGLLIDVRT